MRHSGQSKAKPHYARLSWSHAYMYILNTSVSMSWHPLRYRQSHQSAPRKSSKSWRSSPKKTARHYLLASISDHLGSDWHRSLEGSPKKTAWTSKTHQNLRLCVTHNICKAERKMSSNVPMASRFLISKSYHLAYMSVCMYIVECKSETTYGKICFAEAHMFGNLWGKSHLRVKCKTSRWSLCVP